MLENFFLPFFTGFVVCMIVYSCYELYVAHKTPDYRPRYPINYDLDRFFKQVIRDRDNVKVISNDGYYLMFEYQSRYFSVWVSNKFYAYLSKVEEYETPKRDGKLIRKIDDYQPTKESIKGFHQYIEQGKSPESVWLSLEPLDNSKVC